LGEKVERIYRDVRAFAIPGGSEEIMLDLGKYALVQLFKSLQIYLWFCLRYSSSPKSESDDGREVVDCTRSPFDRKAKLYMYAMNKRK
jgi:hypothetical protein